MCLQKQERARAEEYNRAVEAGLIEPETAPVTLGGANESGNNGSTAAGLATNSFLFCSLIVNIIALRANHLFSSVPPCNSLVSVSDPRWARRSQETFKTTDANLYCV